jgi:hypothetical protein
MLYAAVFRRFPSIRFVVAHCGGGLPPAATNLMAIVLAGSSAPLPIERALMPPFARGHTDDELAAVANFVNGYFGNGTSYVTAADIANARKSLPRSN